MKPPNFRVILLEYMKHLLQNCVYSKLLPPRTAVQAATGQATKNWLLLTGHHTQWEKPHQGLCDSSMAGQAKPPCARTPVLGAHVAVGRFQTILLLISRAQSQGTGLPI